MRRCGAQRLAVSECFRGTDLLERGRGFFVLLDELALDLGQLLRELIPRAHRVRQLCVALSRLPAPVRLRIRERRLQHR